MAYVHTPKRKRKRRSAQTGSTSSEMNLNPLLSVIINLLPLFLIVLNFRHIVEIEQTQMPEAHYLSSAKEKSKELFDVEIQIFNNVTRVEIKDHKGDVIQTEEFNLITNESEKDKILAFITNEQREWGHLTVTPRGSKIKFDQIAQAIDISNFKAEEGQDKLFKNFSIGNIL